MALQQVQVQGKLIRPDGSTGAGSIAIAPVLPASTPDNGSTPWIGQLEFVTQVADDGTVSFLIVPNTQTSPASHYIADYRMRDGQAWRERLFFDDTTPVDIGAVERLALAQPNLLNPTGSIPVIESATLPNPAGYLNKQRIWRRAGAHDALVISMLDGFGTPQWTKVAEYPGFPIL